MYSIHLICRSYGSQYESSTTVRRYSVLIDYGFIQRGKERAPPFSEFCGRLIDYCPRYSPQARSPVPTQPGPSRRRTICDLSARARNGNPGADGASAIPCHDRGCAPMVEEHLIYPGCSGWGGDGFLRILLSTPVPMFSRLMRLPEKP